MLQLARRLHEEHVREGVAKRDALIAEGHATATKIVADAEATANAQITKYEIQIAELEVKTTELKEFEAEYRLRLRTYIEGQLRDLEATMEVPAWPMPEARVYRKPVQLELLAA